MAELSVIIPHYNSSSSLKKLLESIPVSNYIEIIIVDDHSNEMHKNNLMEIRKKNIEKNILLYSNVEGKKGAGSCRNLGILKSTGKWLLFADSDDFFTKDFYNIIEKYFNTCYQVIFFSPTSLDVDNGKIYIGN